VDAAAVSPEGLRAEGFTMLAMELVGGGVNQGAVRRPPPLLTPRRS